MKCGKPFRKGLQELGCGQCIPCRINRQRQITIRGLLEAGAHEHSSFVTLTLDDKHLPSDGCVSVPTAQLFLKRLRYYVGPVRYLISGEYGSINWRPHYHAILFGVREGRGVHEAWDQGLVHISGVGPESIGYVAGYCLKGLTSERGMKWAGKSLRPEFVRWSRRPPIGASAADLIGRFYTGAGAPALAQSGDVSAVVRQGKKLWPLGRYLRERVRTVAGLDRDLLSMRRQLSQASELIGLDQAALNQRLHDLEGISERSMLRSTERVKRALLEKKL